MTEGNAKTDPQTDQPFFSVLLTPYRSLGRSGFLIVMGLITLISFVSGVVFWAVGAWPVAGFLGLDVLAIYIAFRLNYRSGRAFEEVHVSRSELVIRRVSPNGQEQVFTFNPYWARLHVECLPDEGVTRLTLTSHGRELELGSFLNPADRETFSKAFAIALSDARTGRA
ncbi:DUF2244 domain-containing protein [Coralliovum pocilloporae]|uniref:DUF2244 domain-containing protein n=1 Tax=Coralliovum pocilloporae TaxID=3066369 RepID=UPI0033075238